MRLKLIPEKEVVMPVEEELRKLPVGPVAIIPTEPCCAKFCKAINTEIDTIAKAIGIRQDELRYIQPGYDRIAGRKKVLVLTDKISVLKDFRFDMKEKKICECIKEVQIGVP